MQPVRFAIIGFAVLVTLGLARCAAAAPVVSGAEREYCRAYAEAEYQNAVDAGADFPDDAYEGAQAECEVQWLIVSPQWDEPNYLDQIARLGHKVFVLSDECGAAQ